MSYADYLRSPEWAKRRERALDQAGRRCQLCAYRGPGLDVHHNTYARIGDEAPEDLVVLCRLCHRRHHGARRGPTSPRQDHRGVVSTLRRVARTIRDRQDQGGEAA